MKIGLVIYSDDAEAVWNAFRYANFAQVMGDEVKVFLIGKGVEIESLGTAKFNVREQWQTFLDGGGKLFACGTCLEIHRLKPSAIYMVATLNDLHQIIRGSDRLVSF